MDEKHNDNTRPLNEIYAEILDLKGIKYHKRPLTQAEQTRFEALTARLNAAYQSVLAANPGRKLEGGDKGGSFCRVCQTPMLLPLPQEGQGYSSCPSCGWLGKVFYTARALME